MANLILSPDEFAKEIKVVMEERRLRTDDRPRSLVYEQLMATALTAHPYRTPSIGWMSDLESMSVEDARELYERWYAPNNATSGRRRRRRRRRKSSTLAEKYFGAHQAQGAARRASRRTSRRSSASQRMTVKAPAELPYVLMAFRAPVLRDPEQDWEPYALEMLAGVLDGNDGGAAEPRAGARGTTRELGGRQLRRHAPRPRHVLPRRRHRAPARPSPRSEQASAAGDAEIVADGVTEEELKRVKAQVVAAQVFQRDSMISQAREIGALEIAGISHKRIDLQLEKLREVTPEQVQAVARKYLVDDSLTIALLDPQPLDGRRPAPPPAGARHGGE